MRTLMGNFVVCLHIVLIKYQMLLEKLGKLIVKHPSKLVVTVSLLGAVSCLGFLFMTPPNLQEKFFISENSDLGKNFTTAARYFPVINSRQEEVILTPMTKNGVNVLSNACLKDALIVQKTVMNLKNFQDVCMRLKGKRQLQNTSCMMTNPLEVCDVNEKNPEHCLQAIIRESNNPSKHLSDGRTFKFDEQLFLKDLQIHPNENGSKEGNTNARAIRMIYYLKSPQENDPSEETILSWEELFDQEMEHLRSKMTCASLYFTSFQNQRKVTFRIFSYNVVAIVLTFVVLSCTCILMVTCIMASLRPVVLILGTLITLCVAIGLVSSLSISYLVGVDIWQSTWIIIIFMYCKGATDALILIQDMHKQRNIPSLEHRIPSCMTKSGMALTTSNFILLVVFGLAQMSSFPVFRNLSLVALINILFYCLLFLILFMACLTLCHRNFKCKKLFRRTPVGATSDDTGLLTEDTREDKSACCPLMQIYGKFVCSKPGAALTLMLFIGLVAGCSYLTLKQSETFDSPLMINPSLEAAKFVAKQRTFFDEKHVEIVFPGNLNYSNSDFRNKLQMFGEILGNAVYSERPVESWISRFEEWTKLQGWRCTGPEFKNCLENFLRDPKYAFISGDLNFTIQNDALNFAASYFHLYMNSSKQFSFKKKALESLQRDLATFEEKQNIQILAGSHLLKETEQLIFTEHESTWLVSMAGITTIAFSLVFTANPRIAVVLAIGFVGQVLELMTLMHLWDVPLNFTSIICVSLGFIISINFSIQMSQIRALSVDNTATKRTMDALDSGGMAILFGGVLAILSSIGLGFIYPNLAPIFHRVLPIHFALSVFHSLGYIPSALLITSKPMEACTRAMVPPITQSQQLFQFKEQQTSNRDLKDNSRKSRHTGVAILGISCRFPNAENKDLFWDMLINGKSGFLHDYPANRPDEQKEYHMLYNPKRFTQGRLCALGGAYLNNIRDFDAEFFNISSQEAKAMDPQQRILLQIAYEAIEDAGLRLEDLQKGKTGVFVGAMNLDFSSRVLKPENRHNIDQFHSTGITASILANRISFCLNLTGPSLTVDTACSSSLVALKIASQCLKSGECDVAIVCAPNIILDPSVQIIFSAGGLLAPDGRCKSFDAAGDGYGRGEGFVGVILKLTDDAIMDRDDIYCEIVACGMNNDGQSAVPITAPSANTQAELSQRVLEESGLDAEDIQYLEAHGTGTAIGDVVEIKSIAKTYRSKASENSRVLRIGTVKSNLNHTESASGLAGLIKVALMLKNKILVPTININTLNSKLKLTEKGIKVQDVCEPWIKHDDHPRIAALNSFGYGGSNVHAILQEHEEIKCNSEQQSFRENLVLTLSAHSESALRDMAKQYAKWFKETPEHEERKSAICWSLNTRHSQFPHRLAVVFETLQNAAHLLELFGKNKTGWEDHIAQGKAMTQHSRTVFVFGGQGANWNGMGRQLMKHEALFREIISNISGIIQDLGETWSLENELLCQEYSSKLTGNIIGQPATFSIQYATAKLLESWGITPTAVVGHSLGELAASCVAGVFTLKEALSIIMVRSRCHELCPSNGSMAALGISEEGASQLIIQLRLENNISIAAINDENSVTISGDKESIECVKKHLQLNNMQVFWKDLSTTRAFHSFQVETVKDCFQSQIKSLRLHPQATTIPLYSTVTGDIVSGKTMDENYWWCNFRQPVKFCKVVQNILRDNYKMAIEISAQPTLGHYIRKIAEQRNLSPQTNNVVYVATHPRKSVKDQHKAFLHNTVGQLFALGYPIDWALVQGEESNVCYIRPPTYPWQKKDYWHIQDQPTKREESVQSCQHAFLRRVKPTESFTGLRCWEVEVDLYQFPYLRDHALIQGGPVFPGAACVEMAIAMAVEKFCCDEVEIKNVQFANVLTIPENQVRLLQLQLQDGKVVDTAEFLVKTISGGGSEILLAKGDVTAAPGEGKMRRHPRGANNSHLKSVQDKTEPEYLKKLTTRMKPVAISQFKQLTKKNGFNFGPSFSLISMIWRGNEEAVCIIEVDRDEIKNEMERYIVHPAILDACLQTSVAVEEDTEESETKPTTFPVLINTLLLFDRVIPEKTFCHVLKFTRGNWVTYNMNLMDLQGNILLKVKGFQATEMSALIRSQKLENVAYETKWVESAIETLEQPQAKTKAEVTIVFKDSQGIGQSFSDLLKKKKPTENVIAVDIPVTAGSFQDTLTRTICSAISDVSTQCSKVQLINFLPLDAGRLQASYEAIDHSQILSFVSCVKILQSIHSGNLKNPQLVMVTRNAHVVTSDDEASCFPWSSSILGLRRTASLEFTNIRCTMVDLGNEPFDLGLLALEVQVVTSEDEIAFRGGKRYVNRITWLEESSSNCTTRLHKSDANPSIFITLHPRTHEVCVRRDTLPSLSEDKIQVNVAYTWAVDRGIWNLFRDDSRVVGFSGKVYLAATNKAGIQIGDDVCGMVNTSKIGNQVQVNADHVILKPKGMTDAQAATVPVSLAIVFHVLKKTLGEQQKMHLAIDEPKSGLGLVTVLVAKALGHTVLDVSLGAPMEFVCPEMVSDHESMCKKSLVTKGQVSQVDAAIFVSTPKSKIIQNTYQLLKDGGKLVLLKQDINSHITIPTNKNITVEKISFTKIIQNSRTLSKLWTPVQQLMLSTGLMDQVLQIAQHAVNVFQYIYEARGKSPEIMSKYSTMANPAFAILSFSNIGLWRDGSLEVLPPGIDQQGLKSDRTYMVVGGIRGFGFEVAKWMAYSGAKTIVLVARSKPSESKVYEVSQLTRSTGADIILHQADASSSACMKALKKRLESLPSVAGIVHTAMVLKDELIPTLNVSNFMDIAAPKIKGAFLLHEMSLQMNLDFFVLFSSIASLLGNPGQASYAAANAFLDGLAQYRQHALGLPALSINWGPIKGVGVLQREEAIAEHLSRAGYYLLPAAQAMQYMEQVLLELPDRAQLGVFDVDWHKIQKSTPGLAKSTRLSSIRKGDITENTQDMQSLASRLLMENDPRKQGELVRQYVIELLCSWTGNTPSELDFNSSLYNYGMDSFSGLTFKMQLESSLQLSFEVFYFTQPDTTPTKMIQDIINRLNKSPIKNEPALEKAPVSAEPPTDGSTAQRKLDTEESVHPMDTTSDSATYHLIPLFKPEQAEVRLFCVHPAGRYAMNLAPVSVGFTQQSLVAFYAIGYTEPFMKADNRSVRKLAESYIRMIKEIQRHGPYYLAGQSFGGLVAYEVANILTEQCEDVAFVAMIDTFPWYLPNRTGAARLELLFSGTKLDKLIDGLFEATFEQVLSKLATQSLSLTTEEYKAVRAKNSLVDTIKFLQQRAADQNIPLYDITLLQESLHHDNRMATQKHREWKPPQVRFKGPLTYLKSADQRYTPTRPLQEDSDASWAMLVDGNIDVYICPGDHLALSDPEDAAVVGGILVTAASIRYRTLCPNLPRLPTSFKQRRDIGKFEAGVNVLLYSKKASRSPHMGSMYLDVKNQTLTFKGIPRRTDTAKQENNEKKICIKGLRSVLPGKYEPSAIKIASMTQGTTQHRTMNLALVTSVVTPKRPFNFEWCSFEDMKEFFSVIEAIMGVIIYKM